MIRQIPPVDQFKQQLRAALRQEAQQHRTVKFAKQAHMRTANNGWTRQGVPALIWSSSWIISNPRCSLFVFPLPAV